jgi:hypothetical protein
MSMNPLRNNAATQTAADMAVAKRFCAVAVVSITAVHPVEGAP